MMHVNEIFYHFEATVLNNSWKNIIESFHKELSQGSGVKLEFLHTKHKGKRTSYTHRWTFLIEKVEEAGLCID